MISPSIETKLPLPFAVLGGTVAMSYFSHNGWWAVAGLSFVVAAFVSLGDIHNTRLITCSDIFLFLSMAFFIVAICRMGWAF